VDERKEEESGDPEFLRQETKRQEPEEGEE
jgi:hypothetical protein